MDHNDSNFLRLPNAVIGRVDVGRLVREMEALDNFLSQAAIRQPGTAVKLPKTSRVLDETIQLNQLNVLRDDERKRLNDFLQAVYKEAPMVHISFSADPSSFFMQRLMAWLRQEIHPLVLVQVGLQPNLGAGCVIRTDNRYFDFSLRNRFTEKRDLLMVKLRGANV